MSSMTLAMLLTLKDLASGPLGEFHGKLQKTSQNLMAVGTVAMQAGDRILGTLKAPIAAFAEAENAATALRISMMDFNGVSEGFEKVNELATNLGNKLPGTTADFQNMMRVLKQQGVETKDILDGVGKATAFLAVQLEMPFDQTAKMAAKLAEQTGVASNQMTEFMDIIQKTANIGVSAGEMEMAFGRSAGALKHLGMQGLESANQVGTLFAMLIKNGASAETAGTNFAAVLTGMENYQYKFSKGAISARETLRKLGIELNFLKKDGSFVEIPEMFKQLEKLRKLNPEARAGVIKDMFGNGMDAQFISTFIDGGLAKYKELEDKKKKQADLDMKVEAQLKTLINIWDAASGTFTNLLAVLGKSIAPELKAMSDAFGKLSEKIIAFTEAHPKITKIVVGLTALTGVGLLLGGGLVFGLGVMLNMVATISGAMPIAVTFLSTKFLHLYSTFLKLGAWNAATGVRLTTWAGSLFPRAVTFVSTKFMHLYSTLLKVGQWIIAAPGRLFLWFKSIPAQFAAMMSRIGTGARALGPRLAAFFGGIGRTIAAVTRIGINFLRHPLLTLNALRKVSWSAITGGLRAVMLGIRAVGMAALSNPVGAMIAVLVVAAVLVYKYWKPIKGFFKGLWQGLKVGLQPLGPAFKTAFGPLMPLIRPVIGAAKSLWNWFKNILKPVDDVGNKGQKMGVRVGLALARIINKGIEVVAYFSGLAAKFFTWGSQMMSGLANGISSAAGKVIGKLKEIGGQIKSTFTGLLGIKSPSRVFMGYGQMLGDGLQLGMDSSATNILKASQRMSKAATPELNINKVGGVSGSGSSGFGGKGGMQITFAPNISLSPGSSAAQQVQEVMPLLYQEFKQMMRQYIHDENRSLA